MRLSDEFNNKNQTKKINILYYKHIIYLRHKHQEMCSR